MPIKLQQIILIVLGLALPLGLFWLSDRQQWPTWWTILAMVGIVIFVNLGFAVIAYQKYCQKEQSK
ncbi:hypothetical protein [Convivina intestini]|uniref:Uncharacterized protein n=1 Tax=Convivina intestini TaxID=1505726 RepID=A0A2U1DCR7_9LACO|nr:hypothetical protein [Convivina intestini]PVY85379.1 hypothetical protein C7384_102199 [Convivina intestini]CAH1853033.1 hypothetical protein R077811_00597 [Convivina intestini]SDB85771.1 hypothetical protein SAMN05216341_10260 [Leuconostocaceae bacterium R-53105]